MYRALFLDRADDRLLAEVREVPRRTLPDGEVDVAIEYSSLNYKDGLAVTGKGKIIRGEFPFIPGIDLVGTVEESRSDEFRVGERVLLTGGGLGESFWGGFSQRQRVSAEYLIRLPQGLSPLDAMTIGTAGFTAMLSVLALQEHGVDPGSGEVVVTGASGGVGSVSVALLAGRGHRVVASTGKAEAEETLTRLGASRIVGRDELAGGAKRPLDSGRWVGAVDTVGGTTLEALISQMATHGSIAACGNAGGAELHTTVFPFILRGINLLGIDSNHALRARRRQAWDILTKELSQEQLALIRAEVIPLEQVVEMSERIMNATVLGRVVVDVNR